MKASRTNSKSVVALAQLTALYPNAKSRNSTFGVTFTRIFNSNY